jgi:hypothetical protein
MRSGSITKPGVGQRSPRGENDHDHDATITSTRRWAGLDNGVQLLSFTLPARLALTPTVSSR